MKKQFMITLFLLMLVFMAGCETKTTGEVTKEVCDDACKAEKDDYITAVDALLAQAHEITFKVANDWKSVTKEDLSKIDSLKNEVSAMKFPEDSYLANDYYQRAFGHYSEAVGYVVKANEQRASASQPSGGESRNMFLSKVLDNVQEANKLIIYAEEEEKFAASLVSKT